MPDPSQDGWTGIDKSAPKICVGLHFHQHLPTKHSRSHVVFGVGECFGVFIYPRFHCLDLLSVAVISHCGSAKTRSLEVIVSAGGIVSVVAFEINRSPVSVVLPPSSSAVVDVGLRHVGIVS